MAASGSKPGWKFETTVGVAKSTPRAGSAATAARAAARTRPARARIADSSRGSREGYALPGLGRAAVRAGHRRRDGGLPMEAARARVGADVLGLGRLATALVSGQAHQAGVAPTTRVPASRDAVQSGSHRGCFS